ncbi:hypothetical protein DPMN_053156 [Dreissena polymorpha]|uniref:Uncharacterized protein n=1 Tax=Dreissena polymorpha TaxID=45954 RepID=A0A9D4HQE6_DREPO|nr:hypothetical protein DPMN_053156 [Dreissena polymorpha]
MAGTHDIIRTNVLTKINYQPPGGHFHRDWTINVTFSVKNVSPPVFLVFQTSNTIFKLVQDIIGTNLLTKFHEDRTINMTSRMITRVLTRKHTPLLVATFFNRSVPFSTSFKISLKKVLTKFHGNWTINVTCIVKNTPSSWCPCFSTKRYHFLNSSKISFGTNILTKCHEDLT